MKSSVELWQLIFHIILNIFLLVANDLEDFVFEFLLALGLQFVEFVKHGSHQRCQDLHMLRRHLLSLLDVIFYVSELLFEVVQALDRLSNLLLLALEFLQRSVGQAQEVDISHRLLSVRQLAHSLLLKGELLLNAFLAEGLILDHHDGFWEVLLAEVHLNSIGEEGLHWHLLLTLRFF